MAEKEKEETNQPEPKKGVRDLDFRTDFDHNTGEVKEGSEMQAHYDAEREKLLGTPVAGGKYAEDAPPVENFKKADADAKVELMEGDTVETLTARYSKKQLVEHATDKLKLEVKSNDNADKVAEKILNAASFTDTTADLKRENAFTVAPAAPELREPDKTDEAKKG